MRSPKVSFRLQTDKLSTLDKLVKKQFYKDRTEFLTTAVDKLLEEHNQRGEP